MVWDSVYALLKQDAWVEERLSGAQKQNEDIEKMVKLEQQKIQQFQTKVAKIREGFAGGIYTLEEASARIAVYQQTATKAVQEIKRLGACCTNRKP